MQKKNTQFNPYRQNENGAMQLSVLNYFTCPKFSKVIFPVLQRKLGNR